MDRIEFERLQKRVEELEKTLAGLLSPQTAYSVDEVAELTRYKAWTLRQACNKGRIEGAYKASDKSWRIPHFALEKIKSFGLAK